jgi:CheY-like chemotaxis protein
MRILAVDDDPVFRNLLIEALRVQNHEDVVTAGSGMEALAILDHASLPFDCFLLDIQMPGMNGVELCHAIRQHEVYRRTPIVMITAMSGRSFVDDAFSAGATDYVTKPLDRLEFQARMGMVVRLHEERERLVAYARQIGLATGAVEMKVDFDTPVLIPGIQRGIEFLALENYLHTLGRKSVFSYAAFGIHITNAATIFGRTDPATFVAMLTDVGMSISDGLKTEHVLLAYAGNGDFVGLAKRSLETDLDELERFINFALTDFQDIYEADRLPLPEVRVGELVRGSIFSLSGPTRILDQAIRMAQPHVIRKPEAKLLAV